jgi:DNA-directed RNA polymerase subunit RPC12/RpoP
LLAGYDRSDLERGDVMLSSEDWLKRTAREGVVRCPECSSPDLTMGACAVGAFTIFQEYVCEQCQQEFQAMYGLIGMVEGHGNEG